MNHPWPVRSICFVSTALSLSLAAWTAQADPALPGLSNLNFETYTGSAPKDYFTNVDPTGWTGGNGLIFIASPTSGGNATNYPNATWQAPSVISGLGAYNYVQADGNPIYESGFNYASVTGLTVGQTYSLGFYEAASQQLGFTDATTNQWIVALGAVGSSLYSASASAPTTPDVYCGVDCVYTDTDPTASVAASTLMTVPSEGLSDWQYTSVNLTASATTETLSFLAWGDNGNTTNLPPMAFLTGVNSPSNLVSTPEPASIAIMAVGLVGLGGIARRRRAKRSAAT